MTRAAAVLILTMLAGRSFAQTPEPAPTPTPTPPPPVVSPEVQADRRVTFRLRYPAAKEVLVAGEWSRERTPMTKDTQGDWSATIGPLEPGLYGYSFIADGFTMLDPANMQLKLARSPRVSIVDVPGATPRVDAFQDVPHGAVQLHTYGSKTLGRPRGLAVYTPPDYDKDTKRRFPVLYMLHGAGDNEQTWISLGRAHWILDNVIAQKKALPFLMVMSDSHPIYPTPSTPEGQLANALAVESELLEDVIPFVEGRYRVKADARGRAIAGVSMGGGHSLMIGLRHPDVFAWVLGLSGNTLGLEANIATALDDAEGVNRRLALLRLAVARSDKLYGGNQKLVEQLKTKGINHTFEPHDGAHNWPQWRVYLAQYAPMLFVEAKAPAK